jgi:hypothetical protein
VLDTPAGCTLLWLVAEPSKEATQTPRQPQATAAYCANGSASASARTTGTVRKCAESGPQFLKKYEVFLALPIPANACESGIFRGSKCWT